MVVVTYVRRSGGWRPTCRGAVVVVSRRRRRRVVIQLRKTSGARRRRPPTSAGFMRRPVARSPVGVGRHESSAQGTSRHRRNRYWPPARDRRRHIALPHVLSAGSGVLSPSTTAVCGPTSVPMRGGAAGWTGPWPTQNFGRVGHTAFGPTNNSPLCSFILRKIIFLVPLDARC